MGMFSKLNPAKKLKKLGAKGPHSLMDNKKSGSGKMTMKRMPGEVRDREGIVGSTNSGVGRLQHARVTGGVSKPSVAPSLKPNQVGPNGSVGGKNPGPMTKPRVTGGNARALLSSLAGTNRARRKAGSGVQ